MPAKLYGAEPPQTVLLFSGGCTAERRAAFGVPFQQASAPQKILNAVIHWNAMRKKFLLVSFAITLLILVMLPAPSDADTTANYYIEGYVADTSKKPMEGVTVSVADGQDPAPSCDTDAEGFFSVGVAVNTGLTISFTVYGYSVITCPNTSIQPGTGSLVLNLSKAAYNATTHTYTITGSVADMQCVIMATSNGTVNGQVTFGANPVRSATVTLSPIEPVPGGRDYSAGTKDNGDYEITCPTGTYTLTVSSQGFDQSDPIEVKVTDSPSTVNVTMVKSELKKYLGLDVAHLLMLVGVIVGMLFAVAAWFLSRRMNRPHGLEIIDDSAEEDPGVRYP